MTGMDLQKHIIDTIKEWQLKIGYREGSMKLYYPGESLALLLGQCEPIAADELERMLKYFCDDTEKLLGRIRISGSYERFCLDIPAKGCAYVAGKVPEPEFLKLFLEAIGSPGSTLEKVRECFALYAEECGTTYVEDVVIENDVDDAVSHSSDMSPEYAEHAHSHAGHAFYFSDDTVEEYVYWVEENEFGLTYHRFIKADYERLK